LWTACVVSLTPNVNIPLFIIPCKTTIGHCTIGSKAEWRFWFPNGKKLKSAHFERL
jgi:hypothetical protein